MHALAVEFDAQPPVAELRKRDAARCACVAPHRPGRVGGNQARVAEEATNARADGKPAAFEDASDERIDGPRREKPPLDEADPLLERSRGVRGEVRRLLRPRGCQQFLAAVLR